MVELGSVLRPLLLYTMTAGLGDFVVMGDLAQKIEKLSPGARCLFVHRGNPHVGLWPGNDRSERFFNAYSAGEFWSLIKRLRNARRDGFTVFGLQMAPGSLQGFLLHSFLKKMGVVEYVVDFNLINADIITPPCGNYILDLHLNQAAQLLKVAAPASSPMELPYPCQRAGTSSRGGGQAVGIHPWSRRGHLSCFVWTFTNWVTVIRRLLEKPEVGEVVIFGRDPSFDSFRSRLQEALGQEAGRVRFECSQNVGELTSAIAAVDLLISVNTSVVHIGYALQKRMVILSGPSLDLWVPKHDSIKMVGDEESLFNGSDKWSDDQRFSSVARIDSKKVIQAAEALLAQSYVGRPGG